MLTANINQLASDRDDLDADIAEYNAKIELTVKEMKEATAERAAQKATFEKELAELEKGEHDVHDAIDTLKSSEALVSVKSVIKTIRQAVLMADAMGNGPKHQHVIAELLQSDQPEVPMDNYQAGRAGDIIDTVEDLDKDFIEKIAEIKKVETQRLADFDLYMQLKTDTKKKTEASLADAQEQKAKKMEAIGQDNQELSDTNAQLLDDQAYIKDLVSKCSLKSRQWDQRSEMRSEELTALSTALTIVKERVSAKTSDKTVRLLQARAAKAPAAPAAPEAAEEAEEDEVSEVAEAF